MAERMRAERELQISHNHQSALNALLRISVNTPEATLDEQLKQALEHILSISWLPILSKGAIFLTDKNGRGENLTLEASRGFEVEMRMGCQNLAIGECLCGQAVAEKRMIFSGNLDERHKLPGPDMMLTPHGHYCVPILSGATPLGVLTLYLNPGHKREDHEIAFCELGGAHAGQHHRAQARGRGAAQIPATVRRPRQHHRRHRVGGGRGHATVHLRQPAGRRDVGLSRRALDGGAGFLAVAIFTRKIARRASNSAQRRSSNCRITSLNTG